MVHLRLNETEPNPNPHINFITALPTLDPKGQEEARQLLRALAAQVRPIMKAHGFTVNSFEEYEYNTVFAGRNWNNGETIELVLRRADGSYCPTSWLMSTFCHELAHIKHMDHGPAFQALWTRLRREVRQLQDKGYYGDGYWSSGTRLADSVRVSGDGIGLGDLPEYLCGGAQTRAKPSSLRRRRRATQRPRDTVPSLHTGRQTAKRRKAGGRVTSKFAFVGDGKLLADDAQSSKGKRAASNRAREERALAAEKRLSALQNKGRLASGIDDANRSRRLAGDTPLQTQQTSYESSESESEIEFVQETDAERRQALLNSQKSGSTEDDRGFGKGLFWKDFDSEFRFNTTQPRGGRIPSDNPEISNPHPEALDVIDLTDNSDTDCGLCDVPTASGSTFIVGTQEGSKGGPSKVSRPTPNHSLTPRRDRSSQKLELGNLVKSEVEFRKKEALGLGPSKDSDRTLGQAPKVIRPRKLDSAANVSKDIPQTAGKLGSPPVEMWNCLVCTLENQPTHLACAACTTPRGEDTYHIR